MVKFLILLTTISVVCAIFNFESSYNSTSQELITILKQNSNDVKAIEGITTNLERCYSLYKESPFSLYFLERILLQKTNHILNHPEHTSKESNNILNGLNVASVIKPTYFQREAIQVLIKNPKLKLDALLKKFQNPNVESTNIQDDNDFQISIVESSHPNLENLLKNSTIIFVLLATMADACGVAPIGVCQVSMAASFIAITMWFFHLTNIFEGIAI